MITVVFSLIGNIASFIGTVLLSAGLLRSSEQIKDEEAEYWDVNPYKVHNALQAQPLYRAGFRMLVVGFAINIAVALEGIFTFKDKLPVLLSVSFGFTFLGLLLVQIFEERSRFRHQAYKTQLQVGRLFHRLKRIATESKAMLVKEPQVTAEEYAIYREGILKEVEGLAENVPEDLAADIRELMEGLKKAGKIDALFLYLSDFLKDRGITRD